MKFAGGDWRVAKLRRRYGIIKSETHLDRIQAGFYATSVENYWLRVVTWS